MAISEGRRDAAKITKDQIRLLMRVYSTRRYPGYPASEEDK